MPGIFGLSAQKPNKQHFEAINKYFQASWGETTTYCSSRALFGCHSFESLSCSELDGLNFVADGDRAVYRRLNTPHAKAPFELSKNRGGFLTDDAFCNLAVHDSKRSRVFLMAEESGSFPLYYVLHNQSLYFSSQLRPLAEILAKRLDLTGVQQFLLEGFTTSTRTQFEGISKILPGETLEFDTETGKLISHNNLRLWDEVYPETLSASDIADKCWALLCRNIDRTLGQEQSVAHMLSGGWDSRLMLAVLLKTCVRDKLLCYTHGDTQSRELGIVRVLAEDFDLKLHQAEIEADIFDVSKIANTFTKFETLLFPHWVKAGRFLKEQGVDVITAGVSGETLGGHCGPAWAMSGFKKFATIFSSLLGQELKAPGAEMHQSENIRRTWLRPYLKKPWYLSSDVYSSNSKFTDEYMSDIEGDLNRYCEIGSLTDEQIIEAFITHHRDSLYMNAQLLSCRTEVDIAIPFLDRELLEFITRLPLRKKVYNLINRKILKSHYPELLRKSSAATLVPLKYPIWVQELSRAFRKLSEKAIFSYYQAKHIETPRLGWVNYKFLSDGVFFEELCDELKSPLWDRNALRLACERVKKGEVHGHGLHSLSDQLLKLYSVELMTRGIG